MAGRRPRTGAIAHHKSDRAVKVSTNLIAAMRRSEPIKTGENRWNYPASRRYLCWTASIGNHPAANSLNRNLKENTMASVAMAAAETAKGLAGIEAGKAANEALSVADLGAQIQKKANTAMVNAV
jgi:hypothetical protein